MEYMCPEMLKHIFMYLDYNAILSAYNTCTYWRNVIDEHEAWEGALDGTITLLHSIWPIGHEILNIKPILNNSNNKKPLDVISRLSKIFLNEGKWKNCFLVSGTLVNLPAILKIDSSIAVYHIDKYILFNCRKNPTSQRIISNLKRLILVPCHMETFYYIYSENSQTLLKDLVKHIFEEMHVAKIIFMPTVLACSISYKRENCIIIYTNQYCTDLAVIIDYKVKHWINLPISIKYMSNLFRVEYLVDTEKHFFQHILDVIKEFLTNLSDDTVQELLQSVFLIGPYSKPAVLIHHFIKKLQCLFPEHRLHIGIQHFFEHDLKDYCPDADLEMYGLYNRPLAKYEPPSAYCVTLLDYIVYGMDIFEK